MADTIYLIRGQDLDITASFADDAGAPITIDGTFTVTSSMRSMQSCNDAFSLAPTVSGGNVIIHRSTDDLEDAKYVFDIVLKTTPGNRDITTRMYLQLDQPITPLT
jgi:hypothetical protein